MIPWILFVAGAFAQELAPLAERQPIDAAAWQHLPPILLDPNPAVRIAGVLALPTDLAGTASLEIALRTDPDPEVRAVAWEEVLRRWDAGVRPEWHQDMVRWVLRNGYPVDRAAAAEALAARATEPALVAEALADPLVDVRRPAVAWLVAHRDAPDALARLAAWAEREPDAALSAEIVRALDPRRVAAAAPAPVVPAPVVPAPSEAQPAFVAEEEPASPEVSEAPAVSEALEPTEVPADAPVEPVGTELPPEVAQQPEPTGNPLVRAGEETTLVFGAVYGGYLGGVSGWLAGEATERSENSHSTGGIGPGSAIGAMAGVGLSLLVSAETEGSPTRTLAVSSTTAIGGLTAGHFGAMVLSNRADGAPERIQAAALGGTLGGLGVGLLVAPRDPSPAQMAHLDLAAGLGWVVGSGISDVARLEYSQRQERGAIAFGTTMGTLGIAGVANALSRPGTTLSGRARPPEVQTFAVTGVDGLWFCSWAPYLWRNDPADTEITGGTRIGLGAGWLGGWPGSRRVSRRRSPPRSRVWGCSPGRPSGRACRSRSAAKDRRAPWSPRCSRAARWVSSASASRPRGTRFRRAIRTC